MIRYCLPRLQEQDWRPGKPNCQVIRDRLREVMKTWDGAAQSESRGDVWRRATRNTLGSLALRSCLGAAASAGDDADSRRSVAGLIYGWILRRAAEFPQRHRWSETSSTREVSNHER